MIGRRRRRCGVLEREAALCPLASCLHSTSSSSSSKAAAMLAGGGCPSLIDDAGVRRAGRR